MLDKLIKDMQDKGLVAVGHLKFKGEAKACFNFLSLMVDTKAYRPDAEEWNYIIVRMVRDGGSAN